MSKRPLTNPEWLPRLAESQAGQTQQKAEALREAYKRHSSELLAIDEQQIKLLLVMLGIFSAGATLLASRHERWSGTAIGIRAGLTLVSFALLTVWAMFTVERHSYRHAVRDLLVRCEVALGFYTPGAYLDNDILYTSAERFFPVKGQFLFWTHLFTVCIAAGGFVLMLWCD